MIERDLSPVIVGSKDYLAWEREEESLFRQRFGGKALGLRRLCQHGDVLGFSVPRFALVSTSFFDDYLEYNGIQPEDISFENRYVLQEVISEGSFPLEQSEALYQAYESLRIETALIRSSSFYEDDGGNPFKGIYMTSYFNPIILIREGFDYWIKKVYASVYSTDAFQYRDDRNLSHQKEKMGLVIMQEVGEIAGGVNDKGWFSGVSCFEPLACNTVKHYLCEGANTAVTGYYVLLAAYQKSGDVIHSSSSYPTESSREDRKKAIRLQSSSSGVMPKLNNIFLALQSIYGPIELEWSVVDDEIYIYQMRVQERQKLEPIDWLLVEGKQKVCQGDDYFGHGIVKVPALTTADFSEWLTLLDSLGKAASEQLKLGGKYAFIGDFSLFLEEYADRIGSMILSQGALNLRFPNLGVIINTGRQVSLGAHYSEFFARNKILIINVESEDLSSIRWKDVTSDEEVVGNIQISERPIWVVVDALQEKAAIFLD